MFFRHEVSPPLYVKGCSACLVWKITRRPPPIFRPPLCKRVRHALFEDHKKTTIATQGEMGKDIAKLPGDTHAHTEQPSPNQAPAATTESTSSPKTPDPGHMEQPSPDQAPAANAAIPAASHHTHTPPQPQHDARRRTNQAANIAPAPPRAAVQRVLLQPLHTHTLAPQPQQSANAV